MKSTAQIGASIVTAGEIQYLTQTNHNALNILGYVTEFRIATMVQTKSTVFVPRINANAVIVSGVQIAICLINAFQKKSLVTRKSIVGKKQETATTIICKNEI